jgi:hypothetical protein
MLQAKRIPSWPAFRTASAILELLDCVTDEQPLILAVEDSHWLDPLSLELLQQLADWVSSRRLLVIVTARRDEVARRWRAEGTYSIRVHELRPLNTFESKKLLQCFRQILDTPHDAAIDELHISASGGNPYHLTELALRVNVHSPQSEVSTSMSGLIKQRLERLHGSSLRVLQATSVLGSYATIQRVLAILQRSAEEMLDCFDELERQGLLESTGQHLSCRHELVASSALEDLGSAATRLLHLRAAQVLSNDQAVEPSLGLLWATAEHWLAAGEYALASEKLKTCAQQSLRLGSPRDAARTLRRAAELPQEVNARIALLLECAEILARSSQWAEVAETLEAMQRITSISPIHGRHDERELLLLESSWFAGTPAAEILGSLAHCLRFEADPVHCLMAAQLALRLCDNTAAADDAHAMFSGVTHLLTREDVPRDLRLEVELVYNSSFGDLDRSARVAREWIGFWRQTPEDPRLIRALHWGALALHIAGHLEEARGLAREAFDAASKRDLPARASAAADALSDIMWHLGDLQQAKTWADEGIRWCRRMGRVMMGSSVLMQGVRVALAQNSYDVADELFRESEAFHGTSTQARSDVWSMGVRLYLQMKLEHERPPAQAVNEFLALFMGTCHLSLMDHLCFIAYDLLRACDRADEARELLTNFISTKRRGVYPLLPPLREAVEAEGVTVSWPLDSSAAPCA